MAGYAFNSLAGAGVQAVSSTATTAAVAGTAAAAGSDASAPDAATGYFTDMLLRPQDVTTQARADDDSATAEVSRILIQGAMNDGVPEADRAYVSAIVASRAGIAPEDARARVDQILKQSEDAKDAALKAADDARKSAATAAMLGALSLLVGVFIASVAAALGGRQRDDEEAALIIQH